MYYYDDYVLSQNMAQRSRLCIHSQGRKFKHRRLFRFGLGTEHIDVILNYDRVIFSTLVGCIFISCKLLYLSVVSLPTIDILKKKKNILVETRCFFLCNKDESILFLFWKCHLVWHSLAFGIIGIRWKAWKCMSSYL